VYAVSVEASFSPIAPLFIVTHDMYIYSPHKPIRVHIMTIDPDDEDAWYPDQMIGR